MNLHTFPVFNLYTDHPVAIDSRDHTHPHGTKNDNTRNKKFVDKVTKWFWMKGPINFLDIGCAGGGLVSDMDRAGHFAVGLEGSNYNLLNQRAEWAVTPHLFATCDVTRPFLLAHVDTKDYRPLKFEMITSWDFLEHCPEDRLDQFFVNLKTHLAPGGIFVASISANEEFHHVCVHPREWWEEKFQENGFTLRQDVLDYLRPDFVRGPDQPEDSGSPRAGGSFHLACSISNGDGLRN